MPLMKLNPRNVGSVRPRPGRDRDVFWDQSAAAPSGFGVRVSGDTRSYILGYRVRGRYRWLTLGRVDVLSLSQARGLARRALARVAHGEDPATAKADERRSGALTLAALVEQYVEHGVDERSDKTQGDYGRQARALAGTALGKTPASAVTRAEVREHVERVAEDAPTMANRVLALIRATCRWAVGRDLLPADPTAGIERPGTEAPKRIRLDDDQLRAVWGALDVLSAQVAACVRVMLLLGTRKSETCRMRWADLDLDGRQPTWTIPPADRKGGRALVVPLPPAAVKIVKGLQKMTGKHEYVFAGKRGGPLSSNPNRWATAVREASDVEFSPHALRRTFARGVARLGVPSELVSRLLGHKVAAGTLAVTEGYSEYDFLPERAKALGAWSRHVEAVVSGKRKADVLPMVRA